MHWLVHLFGTMLKPCEHRVAVWQLNGRVVGGRRDSAREPNLIKLNKVSQSDEAASSGLLLEADSTYIPVCRDLWLSCKDK